MMGERPDGLTTTYLVCKFRADFRLAMMMCVVKRAAAMQLGSGLPSGCVRGDLGLLTAALRGCGSLALLGGLCPFI